MKKSITYCISILLLYSCDYYDNRLIIKNNSENNIYVTILKDTLLTLGENKTFLIEDSYIPRNSKSSQVLPGSQRAWEFFANESINEKLHIFILLEDTLKESSPTDIVLKQKYLQRLDVSIEDLEKNNWTINYPK